MCMTVGQEIVQEQGTGRECLCEDGVSFPIIYVVKEFI